MARRKAPWTFLIWKQIIKNLSTATLFQMVLQQRYGGELITRNIIR